jgi:riboflavin kinase
MMGTAACVCACTIVQEKTVEPHLLHKFESDFYGSKLKYLIVGYLRPEKDFPSLDALVEAIQNDISQSDTWLETAEGKAFLKDALFQ